MHPYIKPLSILLLASSALLAAPTGATTGDSAITRHPSPEFLAGRELPRKRPGSANVMALYELAMISRLCSARTQAPVRNESRSNCARSLFEIRRQCTRTFQHQFPRADNRRADGRLDHESFAAGYRRCLLKRYRTLNAAAGAQQ